MSHRSFYTRYSLQTVEKLRSCLAVVSLKTVAEINECKKFEKMLFDNFLNLLLPPAGYLYNPTNAIFCLLLFAEGVATSKHLADFRLTAPLHTQNVFKLHNLLVLSAKSNKENLS